MASAWRVVGRDLRVLATRPWFTLMMVPAAVVAMMILTALVVAAGGDVPDLGEPGRSAGLLQQVPAWLMIPVLVVIGPFVEEYIFRHLLIGKLPPYLNIWVCCAISVIPFAGHPYRRPGGPSRSRPCSLPGHGRDAGVCLRVDREEPDVLLLCATPPRTCWPWCSSTRSRRSCSSSSSRSRPNNQRGQITPINGVFRGQK